MPSLSFRRLYQALLFEVSSHMHIRLVAIYILLGLTRGGLRPSSYAAPVVASGDDLRRPAALAGLNHYFNYPKLWLSSVESSLYVLCDTWRTIRLASSRNLFFDTTIPVGSTNLRSDLLLDRKAAGTLMKS